MLEAAAAASGCRWGCAAMLCPAEVGQLAPVAVRGSLTCRGENWPVAARSNKLEVVGLASVGRPGRPCPLLSCVRLASSCAPRRPECCSSTLQAGADRTWYPGLATVDLAPLVARQLGHDATRVGARAAPTLRLVFLSPRGLAMRATTTRRKECKPIHRLLLAHQPSEYSSTLPLELPIARRPPSGENATS